MNTRRALLSAALVVAGLVAGAGATFAALYEKPGQRAADKVLRTLGLRTDVEELYAFGREKLRSDTEWKRVRSPKHAQWAVRPGLDVQLVVDGLTDPVNLVFPLMAGDQPDDVLFYVGELHGRIKYVTRAGRVAEFAKDLINFTGAPVYKTDERGITGLTTVPGSRDLIATGTYVDEASGLLRNRVLRLVSSDDGKSATKVEVLLDMDEFTAPSHQIQQAMFGPDGKLYVSVGDGETPARARDLTKFAGKMLRMNADGSAAEDNPFYDAQNARAPRSYVHALGLRNVFDYDFEPGSGRLYAGDNGQNDDRLIQIVRGGDYAWNARFDASRLNALYTWGPVPKTVGPVGVAILRRDTLGPGSKGKLYIGLCGVHQNGESHAKMVQEFGIDPTTGLLTGGPEPVVQYIGKLQGTVIGVEEGPDGLYFTDIFGEIDDHEVNHTGTGRVWKIVPSKETLDAGLIGSDVSKLGPTARGAAYFQRYCTGCHRIDGNGGKEGPDLTHVASELDRLNTPAYDAELKKLLASEQTFLKEQRPRLTAVRDAAPGPKRKEAWLHHHIEEPRFDNPFGRMPPFAAIPLAERQDIIRYLLDPSRVK
jgi:glucose/arabinose dehydrogenase